MKIYTYYDNINFHRQEELLNIWKASWETSGFEANILTAEDAKQSPLYEEFLFKLQLIHTHITGRKMSDYGIACYLRWLAYSIQETNEPFFAADYDVISKGFKPSDVNLDKDKLSFLDRYCPCLAYGSKNHFLNFCQDICSITLQNIHNVKDEFQKYKFVHYHDQEFLALNHQRLSNEYKIYPAREFIKLYAFDPESDNKLFHFAHRSVYEFKEKFPEYKDVHSDELRIKIIKDALYHNNY